MSPSLLSIFFFFNDTATTEIYTLSLHDALPIFPVHLFVQAFDHHRRELKPAVSYNTVLHVVDITIFKCEVLQIRSEEHTSELQSQSNLVCRLLLEKKKNNKYQILYVKR